MKTMEHASFCQNGNNTCGEHILYIILRFACKICSEREPVSNKAEKDRGRALRSLSSVKAWGLLTGTKQLRLVGFKTSVKSWGLLTGIKQGKNDGFKTSVKSWSLLTGAKQGKNGGL